MSQKIALIGTTATSLYGFRADMIKKLVAEGHVVYAFTSEYSDEDLDKVRALGADPIIYKLNRGGLNPFVDIQSMLQLSKKLKQLQPNIVFSYFTKPVIYGTLAAQLARIPKKVGMIEGLGSPFTIHKYGQSKKLKFIRSMQVFLYRLVFPFLDKIIFLNPDDPVDLIVKNKIYHKDNAIVNLGAIGLDLSLYRYTEWNNQQEVSFIFIGRLLAEKGVFEYIESARIVKDRYPNIKFKIIGSLDTENPYSLQKEQLDNIVEDGIIEYHGFVDNVHDYIRETAVFVLPSYYREGVPRSTQEAMAIGRPVITTDVPGCRETVIDGVNGFLVPKWNTEILAEKMIFFIENPQQIAIMGNESYKIAVEKFDAEKVNNRLIQILFT